MKLTRHQIDLYHREGYLILHAEEHKLVHATELKEWSTQVQNFPTETGKWMPYYEINGKGEKQLMRTENFVDYHDGFGRLLCGDELANVLQQLTGDEMVLFKDKINYKLAGGNGFGAHLDSPAYDHIGQHEYTTANLAVDAATPENGCIEVVPRSHRMPVSFRSGGHLTAEWEAAHTWTPVPLAPGDMLLFGSHLAHRSGPNTTAHSRAMVYATYNRRSDGVGLRRRYYADRMAEFPPEHERVAGRDYSAGVQRYAFAAPFMPVEGVATSS